MYLAWRCEWNTFDPHRARKRLGARIAEAIVVDFEPPQFKDLQRNETPLKSAVVAIENSALNLTVTPNCHSGSKRATEYTGPLTADGHSFIPADAKKRMAPIQQHNAVFRSQVAYQCNCNCDEPGVNEDDSAVDY